MRYFVIFLGNPRSGTTLVRSLLNAHPDVCISVEVDVFKRLRDGASWQSILNEIVYNTVNFAINPVWTDYRYDIQQVGLRSHTPLILGDKKASKSSQALALNWALADRLADLCYPAGLKVIQCVRNPLDTIATRKRRSGLSLEECIGNYFEREATAAAQVRRSPMTDATRVYLETLIRFPEDTLKSLLAFLGIDEPPGYINACCGLIYDQPAKTRDQVVWTRENLSEVLRRTKDLPHLAPYQEDCELFAEVVLHNRRQ